MMDHRNVELTILLIQACWRIKETHPKQGAAPRKSPGPSSLSPWSDCKLQTAVLVCWKMNRVEGFTLSQLGHARRGSQCEVG